MNLMQININISTYFHTDCRDGERLEVTLVPQEILYICFLNLLYSTLVATVCIKGRVLASFIMVFQLDLVTIITLNSCMKQLSLKRYL